MYRPTFIVNIIKNDNEREREIYSDLTYNKKMNKKDKYKTTN